MNRLIRAWRSKFKDDKKDVPFGDPAEVWSRPPGMVSMRKSTDPFINNDVDIDASNGIFAPRAMPSISPRFSQDIDLSPGVGVGVGVSSTSTQGVNGGMLPANATAALPPLRGTRSHHPAADLPPLMGVPRRSFDSLGQSIALPPSLRREASNSRPTMNLPSFAGPQRSAQPTTLSGQTLQALPRVLPSSRIDPFAAVPRANTTLDPFAARPSPLSAPQIAAPSLRRPAIGFTGNLKPPARPQHARDRGTDPLLKKDQEEEKSA